ncbi:MAG TPA: sigma-54 dependent transcriptional regulator [Candidatus Hydrogenedentes bacterium]|nr:sigma-54 dependent transcriptional regulator [Candidatus Hydrogenedentota bacterium]HOL76842.1 sigma-54 dependent transcriptional regulator [Candidatus Hydrogenedentota bacterium]HPO86216.1 sigma-54 dependent transcriptional regulator [Candidatus Hydrogenedentota bacterium]
MTNHQPRPRVLVADDEAGMRELLEIVLGNEGYEVLTAADIHAAKELLQGSHFDCVITDLRFGAQRDAGMHLLRWIHENEPAVPTIMITAYGSVETAIEAMKQGAADYILKPFKNEEMRLVVGRAIEKRNLIRENIALRKDQALRGKLDNLIGKSRAMEEVRDMIRRVATVPSTVAIHGESGTGKELVARAIHGLSDRAEKPFVAVNCGAFPENLLESELFGYKKGAFTGAVEDKDGLFVVANGGTLFLDEIGEMPLNLQVKLLRVLDNGLVLPVGGTAPIPVNVRIISATNRNLEEMVRNNTFREDLYYRLNVIPIVVPPLRERAEDIPLLVRHFIIQHAAKMNRPPLQVSPEAEQALRSFTWPGNVRELENVIERAVALCSGQQIELMDLPKHIQHHVAAPDDVLKELPEEGLDLEAYVAELETRLIKQALERTRFSQKRAAELLRLSPRSFRYRLQKYGLEK